MTTRQFDRIYIFEEVGNVEDKYVFTAPFMSAIELYKLFLKWCSKVNFQIAEDIEDHELDTRMTTTMEQWTLLTIRMIRTSIHLTSEVSC